MRHRHFKLDHRRAPGLVGLWGPGPAGGPFLYDESGYENDGTLENGPTWVFDLERGWVLNLDGVDDKIVGSVPRIVGGTELSMVAWVYATGWGGNNNGRIVSAETASTYLYLNGSGGDVGIGFGVDLSGITALAQGTNLMSLNAWHLLCGTRNVSGIHLYVDGQPTNKDDANSVGNGTIVDHSGNTLCIGGRVTDNDRQFVGQIGPVRIYNRTLSGAEVEYIYQKTKPNPYSDIAMQPSPVVKVAAVGFVSRKHSIIGGGILGV